MFLFACGAPASSADAGDASETADAPEEASALDAADSATDGGPFVTGVVSFEAGPCSGFGAAEMPGIVEGPPVGGGNAQGSTDVVSLGVGGSIVLSFAPNEIVDGAGKDFVVFENAFYVGGNKNDVFAEPGEVSVSDDGVTWSTYPCNWAQAPYASCAGVTPVTSSPTSGISPLDYPACGGDGFDLADLGVAHAKYVRIVDMSHETCTTQNNAGFDLDAIAIIHSQAQ